MDKPRTTPTAGATFIKAVLLIVGGALLGFFGCLGGISMNSAAVFITTLAGGAIAILWGLVLVVIAIVRAVTKA